ncbi:unnamed protein product [Linum tenue]|uniref:V-type proton ATPase subunit G n=1 Tax=Linum tenue TaxID=586396 RepID=A0AAV0I2E8_9ROSI|nr:unnamed protein product [Linum tenue]
MESSRGNGIQLLLAAEQEAQHIVNAARNGYCINLRGVIGFDSLAASPNEFGDNEIRLFYVAKLARLKQAKDEAEREATEFRAQMEAQYQAKLTETSGDSGANVKRLEQETQVKIGHLKEEGSRISHDVIDMLLRQVTTVKN